MMQAFYTDEFVLPLPPGHRFPMQKYKMLRDKVQRALPGVDLQVPPAASDGQLALAHCPHYIARVVDGSLSAGEQKAIGFPWSERMVERSRRSVGATVAAVRSALQHGSSVNLAGGTHHAMHSGGAGFCVFNDLVVAARVYQTDALSQGARAGCVPKVLVVDLDVHQGDGTAQITERDPSIFTLSLHGDQNFPFTKMRSDLDVALPNGTGDEEYLKALEEALSAVGACFTPDLMLYVAGLDVHGADRLGKLALSDSGIQARDHLVLDWAISRRLPVVATMAGGYFPDLDHLTDLQCGVVERLSAYGNQLTEIDLIKTLN
ncbi:MAG TPA: histone deacetylase [Limnobacter sp.]|nr:histone deacetylase [Limnobacter sp.]